MAHCWRTCNGSHPARQEQTKDAKLEKSKVGTYMGVPPDVPGGMLCRSEAGVVHPLRLPITRNIYVDENRHWLKLTTGHLPRKQPTNRIDPGQMVGK